MIHQGGWGCYNNTFLRDTEKETERHNNWRLFNSDVFRKHKRFCGMTSDHDELVKKVGHIICIHFLMSWTSSGNDGQLSNWDNITLIQYVNRLSQKLSVFPDNAGIFFIFAFIGGHSLWKLWYQEPKEDHRRDASLHKCSLIAGLFVCRYSYNSVNVPSFFPFSQFLN